MKLVCIDTEYDARYTERGVGKLACMTYSVRTRAGVEAGIVGHEDAARLWVKWARDPKVRFLVHSGYYDFGVLADEAHRVFEGEDVERPGFGPYWELAHALYDARRVVDTEIRQRLTFIRFGPHKASVQLGALAQMLLGLDVSDSKSVPDEAEQLLLEALPWSQWPEELLAKTPWRVKFGLLRERFGNDVSHYPNEATEYALDDAKLPWQIYDLQQRRWDRPIPNLHEQTVASWKLHMTAIPGWLADRERAQSIRKVYRKTIANCERTLLAARVLEIDGPRAVQKQDVLKGQVFLAFGDKTPLSKTAAKNIAAEGREPTREERRERAAKDVRTCIEAIEALGGPVIGKTPKRLEKSLAQILDNADETLQRLQEPSAWRTLYAHVLHSKLSGSEDDRAPAIVEAAYEVLVEAGVFEVVTRRVVKQKRVQERVFAILGRRAALTDKGFELYGHKATDEQRLEYCSKDAKAIRAAILHKGAKTLEIADAVEASEKGEKVFDAWLEGSKEKVLNALAVRSKADKTIVNFLDKLDTPRRVRTSYQTLVDTGRTSSRAINIQQYPRDYDKPKSLHIRGCIIPDPGWAFVIADYTQLELCSLAHILTKLVRNYARSPSRKKQAERLLGFEISEQYVSTLARAINNDQDCHVKMASVLRGRGETYEDVYSIYEVADHKKENQEPLTAEEKQVVEDRQLAKPCNFGFPGGLGALSFVDYAAGYGVAITPAIAQRAQDAYMAAWPEMRLYFWHIKQCIKKHINEGEGGGICVQIGSRRERGGCEFTQWANGWFQGLAADGAKEAASLLIDAAYRRPESPMYGTLPSGFVHDEFLVNARVEQAERALPEVERLMIAGMRRRIPDVKIKAPGKVLYERWGK